MLHNKAYSLPHKWEGQQCLLNVDLDVVSEIKDFISNGKDLFFPLITVEFEKEAEDAYRPFISKTFLLLMSGMAST